MQLSDLIESFSNNSLQDEEHLARKYVSLLMELYLSLAKIKRKFVDIDTSLTEVEEAGLLQFKEDLQVFGDKEFSENMTAIYDALNLYLLVRDRFGDAADWNLKEEFEERLARKLFDSLDFLRRRINFG